MKKRRGIFCCMLCVVLLLVPEAGALAGENAANTQSFESVTDEFMETVLLDDNVAGAAVSVVKDGNVLFEKGYGWAYIENKVPVDAQTTSFQIASVSKLFTATAVMQMVEQGKLLLDEDVNNYLTAFKIDNPFANPVTLRTLLTHTSGLDCMVPSYVPSTGAVLFDASEPLERVLKENLPPVVRNPGTYCQYNVFGMALAGYLVEVASGMPFDRYVTQNILDPLAMEHSSYGLTERILPFMAKPYKYAFGKYTLENYTLISDHPSGSICASAGDMANFMIAHLNRGVFESTRILTPHAAAEMQSQQYPEDGRLTGYGLGFYETVRNGYKTIEHGGYLHCYSSKCSLLPEKNIGVFIAINTDSAGSSKVCNAYVDLFYRYFTQSKMDETVCSVPFDMDAGGISGRYAFTEYGETNFTKIKSVLMTCRVECDKNGNLHFKSSEFDWRFRYVGNGLFYCSENGNYCRLSEIDGEWVINIIGMDFAKVASSSWLLFNLSLLSQPVFAVFFILLTRSLRKKSKNECRPDRVLRITLLAQAALTICYFTLHAVISINMYAAGNTVVANNILLRVMPVVCWLCAGGALPGVILIVNLWIKNETGLREKLAFTILETLFICNAVFMYLMNGMKF